MSVNHTGGLPLARSEPLTWPRPCGERLLFFALGWGNRQKFVGDAVGLIPRVGHKDGGVLGQLLETFLVAAGDFFLLPCGRNRIFRVREGNNLVDESAGFPLELCAGEPSGVLGAGWRRGGWKLRSGAGVPGKGPTERQGLPPQGSPPGGKGGMLGKRLVRDERPPPQGYSPALQRLN